MTRSSFSLERLVSHYPSILDDVAFYLAVDPFLGPPVNLFSLLLTCRTLYNHLSIANNSGLYARIFRHKFDCEAIERRLSARWTSAPCLARELRSRFIALQHIKHGRPSLRLDREALWKAYLMLLEDDGRNEKQLFGWANLPDWVLGVVALRSSPPFMSTGRSTPHLSDPEGMSLAVWLLWMTSSKGKLSPLPPSVSSDRYPERVAAEAVVVRTALTNAILPFLVRGYQHPSVFAPDTYFYLPLCEDHGEFAGFSGPLPLVTQIHYLGHKLKLAVPPLTSAALLSFAVRQEAWQDTIPLPSRIALLPATRVEATARGLATPALTQEDVREFHHHTRTRFFRHDQGITSEQFDKDWFRLVACHTPSAIERPLRGIVYPLGTLVGNWSGRIFVPDMLAYLNAAVDRHVPAASVPLIPGRISCSFAEHHCFGEPLLAPPRHDGLGEDIFNAWLPQDLAFTHRSHGLEIFDPSTGKNTWYETYHPNRKSPYSTSACERLPDGSDREWSCQEQSDSVMEEEDVEDVDEYEDFVEELPSGVQDIIITGETCERQGEAWGYYSYIGRIRPWDGLVVFLRIPMNNQYRDTGRWIFKGYVYERSLVGRWRDTATDEHAVGFEGSFVLCQEDEVNTASMSA